MDRPWGRQEHAGAPGHVRSPWMYKEEEGCVSILTVGGVRRRDDGCRPMVMGNGGDGWSLMG
jgi:hypothetical protein